MRLLCFTLTVLLAPFDGLATEGDPVTITLSSNMIDLELRQVHKIEIRKNGGGLSASDRELILVTGDGQVRVIDLNELSVASPRIALPDNSEDHAIDHARKLKPDSRAKMAKDRVEKWFRYDDVLVVDREDFKFLIVSFSNFDAVRTCFNHRLAILKLAPGSSLAKITILSEDWIILYESEPCFPYKEYSHPFAGHQSGGRMDMVDEANGEILLTLGDYEFDGINGKPEYPQDWNSDYGKVLKVNIIDGTHKVVSVGHRNPQGITVDRNKQIWTVEHGPYGGDELNLVEAGSNYGWPRVILGINYGRAPWPPNDLQGRHRGYRLPVHAWVPSIAPSNIDQCENFHPFWNGDLLVFSLRAESIFRLRVVDRDVIFSEQIHIKERIRYGLSHPGSKSLWLWTDSGSLYRAVPAKQAWELLEASKETKDDLRKAGGSGSSLYE